jgi:hypothetical protein
MVIDPELEDSMKVTVIATGFDRAVGERPRAAVSLSMSRSTTAAPGLAPSLASAPIEREDPEKSAPVDVPFYRKAIAHVRGDDPNGFGPNWSNVDDYDIPTVLRKQMD